MGQLLILIIRLLPAYPAALLRLLLPYVEVQLFDMLELIQSCVNITAPISVHLG